LPGVIANEAPPHEASVPDHLVTQAQRGDHDAFSQLIAERLPRMYGVAGLVTGSRDGAEEAVQEALIHAWRDLPRLRETAKFDAWLHRLLVNACHDQGRRRKRQRGETPLTDQELSGDRDPAQAIANRDELERAFRWLSQEDRAVVVLRHYLGLSTSEAAAVMGMREGTLKSRLHRAMKSMAAAIAAEARPTEMTGGRPA
jgi:RNA polymerase sigma-70 factor, ECF subfamily